MFSIVEQHKGHSQTAVPYVYRTTQCMAPWQVPPPSIGSPGRGGGTWARNARHPCEDPGLRPRSARGGACGSDAGRYPDGAREESHAAARGGDGTEARACAPPRRLPLLTVAPSQTGYSFPRLPPINGLCNSKLCRPRLRPLRKRPPCLGVQRACALCVSQPMFRISQQQPFLRRLLVLYCMNTTIANHPRQRRENRAALCETAVSQSVLPRKHQLTVEKVVPACVLDGKLALDGVTIGVKLTNQPNTGEYI